MALFLGGNQLALLFAQCILVLFLALWLSIGVHDNLRHSEVNAQFVTEVVTLSRLSNDFPELYAIHARRAVTNPKSQRLLFQLIVGVECLVALGLWIATIMLVLALLNFTSESVAQSVALLASLAFTSIWSGFLVAGNYWCYWMCHEGAQNTHYQMTFWGIGVMILVSL